ncbi:MAG: transposase [bacterium]|nr:transposase [bacterium]
MPKTNFANNEYYHIFNRGVDKREVFLDSYDLSRFFESMNEFNSLNPIGSIYENSFRKNHPGDATGKQKEKLVNFICYCLNPNHYHFLLEQLTDRGIEKFMQRLGNGYTKYFNTKYKRSGVLFQGKYKAVHVDSNEYLLHLSIYINLNHQTHQLGHPMSKLSKSSWEEYLHSGKNIFCEKDIVLKQFKDITEYEHFAENSLKDIRERKEMEKLLLE